MIPWSTINQKKKYTALIEQLKAEKDPFEAYVIRQNANLAFEKMVSLESQIYPAWEKIAVNLSEHGVRALEFLDYKSFTIQYRRNQIMGKGVQITTIKPKDQATDFNIEEDGSVVYRYGIILESYPAKELKKFNLEISIRCKESLGAIGAGNFIGTQCKMNGFE